MTDIRKQIEAVLSKNKITYYDLIFEGDNVIFLKTDERLGMRARLEIARICNDSHLSIRFSKLDPIDQPTLPGFPPSQVSHPSHYNSGKIEVIEFIEDQGYGKAFCRGNAIKYAARAGKKDPEKEIEDLEKAVWYLNREIETLKAAKEKRAVTRPNDMKASSIGVVAEYNSKLVDRPMGGLE